MGDGGEAALRRFARRAVRHLVWARREGIGRRIEEDRLDPLDRVRVAAAKWRWRRSHDASPRAAPVFVVGVQRSGTNMVVRGLEWAPEFQVFNENDGRAFDRFRLRPDPRIRALVVGSRHRYVLFKPLCDSHRVGELLDTLGTPSPGYGVWVYRSVEGRVRSAVAKFGASNREALRRIAEGRGAGMWQAGGLSEGTFQLLRSFDYERMTPETGAALFWLVRNSLYFDLGLAGRRDVALVSYEAFLRDPESEMRWLCAFLGLAFRPEMVAHVRPGQGGGGRPPGIDPAVLARCRDLQGRLDAAWRRQRESRDGTER